MKFSTATIVLLSCAAEAFQPRLARRRVTVPHNRNTCGGRRYGSHSALLFAPDTDGPPAPVEEEDTNDSSFLNADRATTFEMPSIHNRTLTKTEQEFRDFLGEFAHFSERDIQSVPSPRMRTLFQGVKASAGEPDVYRSFEVLYTDFLPIRVAGRLIYKKLLQTMKASQALRREHVERVSLESGLDATEVDVLRIAFLSIAQENHFKDGQSFISKEQLQESGIGDIVIQDVGYANVEAFFDVLDVNSDGRLSFDELMMGLHSYAVETCFDDTDCEPSQVLHSLLMPLLRDDEKQSHHRILDEKHQRFSDRYDEMIDGFAEFEPTLVATSGETGRQLDILRGCFVGAKNQDVLEALRIVYVDYRPLRLAGNLIFKLMSALVKSRQT